MFVVIKLIIKLKMLLITWYIFTESSYSSFDLLKLGKLLHSDSGLALTKLVRNLHWQVPQIKFEGNLERSKVKVAEVK